MDPHRHSCPEAKAKLAPPNPHTWRQSFWWRWFATNTIISGTLALIWLLLRSGSKPSRFTYPCQQAAISTATLAFGGPVVAAIIAGRRHLSLWIRMP
ncbi:MAG: hypothetical protein GY720_08320, partial [bacterium]|nr:hypothetical protein [bacterium]